MNPNCIYEVSTRWGSFRLDEGAYRDYLEGKLWISWEPGKPAQKISDADVPVHISHAAVMLRELAAKSDPRSVYVRFFPENGIVPYREKMREISVDEMCLSVRSYHCLMRTGANTLGKVAALLKEENGLRKIRNLGVRSEEEILLGFFRTCYSLLNEYEKAAWWQSVLDENKDVCSPDGELLA